MTESPEITKQRLQSLLDAVSSRRHLSQIIMAVESGDRSFAWVGAAGQAIDGTPVCPNTPFFMASIDKLLNAVVIMKLSERGMLSLDAAISTYLSPNLWVGVHRLSGVDRSGDITVRHLLAHASGLADWLEDRPQHGRSIVERLFQEGDFGLTTDEMVEYVRERLTPHFPPQDLSARRYRTRYSDTNYMLLITIIEMVVGQPLHQVHEQLLLQPLGLRHTYFPGSSVPLDDTPTPFALLFKGQPVHIPLMMRSSRGIYSTVGDCISFLRSMIHGETFQNPQVLMTMQQRWNQFSFPLDRAALRAPGWPIEYGLGMMRFRLPRLFTPFHSVPHVVGHTGSTGSWLFYCPDWDVLLSGSVDEVTAGAVPYRLVPKILGVLRRSRRAAPTRSPTPTKS